MMAGKKGTCRGLDHGDGGGEVIAAGGDSGIGSTAVTAASGGATASRATCIRGLSQDCRMANVRRRPHAA